MDVFYLDCNDIMATEKSVKCRANRVLPRMGYLIGLSGEADLPEHAVVEMPFWKAKHLSTGRQPPFSIILPGMYRPKFLNVALAEPAVFPMTRALPQFYQLVVHMFPLFSDLSIDLRECIARIYRGRVRMITDYAYNESSVLKPAHLDNWETQLFHIGRAGHLSLLDICFVQF
uniref:DNA replication complex GINS protein PSF3 n=1 Tax=Trichuris muris TaxID=70415 RepID=A0A5S6Q3G5_TRIMR